MGEQANSSTSNNFLKNLSQKKYAWMQSTPAASGSSGSQTQPQSQLQSQSQSLQPNQSTSAPSPPAVSQRETKRTSEDNKSKKHHRGTKRSSPSSQGAEETQKDERSLSPSEEDKQSTSALPAPSTPSADESGLSPAPQPTSATSAASGASIVPSKRKKERKQLQSHQQQQLQQQQQRFKYTTFPVKGFNILPTRNITSSFDRTDTSYFPGHTAENAADIAPDPEEEARDTIVIHPGSRNLRIGLSSEAFPKTVPHVIARRMQKSAPTKENGENGVNQKSEVDAIAAAAEAVTEEDDQMMDEDDDMNENEDDETTASTAHAPPRTVVDANSLGYNRDEALREIKNELKWRMKAAKRRAVPNAEGQVVGFNTQAYQETIPDHNDPYKVEWTEIAKGESPEYFVGEKALNLPLSQYPKYSLMYPWKNGTLNAHDYKSIQEVLGDLQTIWTETIRNELEIDETTFENYNAVLVIPDTFSRRYTCELMTMLLRYMKFRGAFVQQESMCATFGAGVSSACVVDIGAQKTSIACIEDGVCLVDSRTTISIGGDDITKTFASFLLANKFPYSDISRMRSYDWRLAEELKEKWCTMNEADISVQVYDFFVRVPREPTKKYQCKVYDEVFLAPLCLVYPAILNTQDKSGGQQWVSSDVIDDIADETQQQAMQNYDVFPLDVAIAQSIKTASGASEERMKRFFTNIILVGGGGMISNFNRVLEDRILSTVIAQSAAMERVEVLPAPRELDPRLLMWKGASVLSKLDTAKEMWIGQQEWDAIGGRCLRERALFIM
ncbi:hypothetical protein BCR43DRAFT_524696 [Syncephalastrum racemosum]|uniref:Uncharacterized protein n=1 Tax=Syncephalastrum racemosum TaxID=13706 RepID=A0A1X2HCX5_SYNRA|nr:hypothetical protein BCR43DRAFT_524696 [Syncephalastrum racemosum]